MKPILAFLIDYCRRHAHPVNALLHIFGVPAAFAGIYFLFCGKLSLAISLIVTGYFLQYLGHEAQGNEVGEVTLLKSIWRRLAPPDAGAAPPSQPALSEPRPGSASEHESICAEEAPEGGLCSKLPSSRDEADGAPPSQGDPQRNEARRGAVRSAASLRAEEARDEADGAPPSQGDPQRNEARRGAVRSAASLRAEEARDEADGALYK